MVGSSMRRAPLGLLSSQSMEDVIRSSPMAWRLADIEFRRNFFFFGRSATTVCEICTRESVVWVNLERVCGGEVVA